MKGRHKVRRTYSKRNVGDPTHHTKEKEGNYRKTSDASSSDEHVCLCLICVKPSANSMSKRDLNPMHEMHSRLNKS